MPGVADQIRKTQLKQEQKARQNDMRELLKMVREGRLHEADERQLETLKLALELNQIMEERQVPQASPSEELIAAVKQAISEGISNFTFPVEPSDDPSRPKMRHVSLAELVQDETNIDISHKSKVSREVKGGESTEKLEKLKKLKGK